MSSFISLRRFFRNTIKYIKVRRINDYKGSDI